MVVGVVLFLVGRPHVTPSSAGRTHAPTSATPLPTVTVSPVPRTAAGDKHCPTFLAALPRTVAGLSRREVDAHDQYFLAWGDPAVVVHCDVPRPAGFKVGTEAISVDGVQWFNQGTTWTAVDRRVYVEVRIPESYPADAALVDIGAAVKKTLPAVPIRPRH